MTFKIINPNWKSQIEQKAATHAPAVSDWMAANSANRYVGIAELRAGLPAIANDLTRQVINNICSILALEIQGADDQTA